MPICSRPYTLEGTAHDLPASIVLGFTIDNGGTAAARRAAGASSDTPSASELLSPIDSAGTRPPSPSPFAGTISGGNKDCGQDEYGGVLPGAVVSVPPSLGEWNPQQHVPSQVTNSAEGKQFFDGGGEADNRSSSSNDSNGNDSRRDGSHPPRGSSKYVQFRTPFTRSARFA